VVTIDAFNKRRAPAAGIVTGTFSFDLDHIGAKVGQHLSGPRAGKNAGELKDTEAS
jgi:hypothetical protein